MYKRCITIWTRVKRFWYQAFVTFIKPRCVALLYFVFFIEPKKNLICHSGVVIKVAVPHRVNQCLFAQKFSCSMDIKMADCTVALDYDRSIPDRQSYYSLRWTLQFMQQQRSVCYKTWSTKQVPFRLAAIRLWTAYFKRKQLVDQRSQLFYSLPGRHCLHTINRCAKGGKTTKRRMEIVGCICYCSRIYSRCCLQSYQPQQI